MGVSDSMEDGLMDKEIQEALELTKEDLLKMADAGKTARIAHKEPRRVRRKQDLNQRTAGVVTQATERQAKLVVRLENVPPGMVLGLPSTTEVLSKRARLQPDVTIVSAGYRGGVSL
jgi:uncharacterized membrane protein